MRELDKTDPTEETFLAVSWSCSLVTQLYLSMILAAQRQNL